MLINKITGETYKDRREAKTILGHYTYNQMVKDKTITFHNDITIYNDSDIVI